MARGSAKLGASSFAIERRSMLLERLQKDGRLEATVIAEELGISTETIRRDLIALEEAGELRRVHGGAVLEAQKSTVPDMSQRGSLMMGEKEAIANLAKGLIPLASLVLIDGGTTTHALAEVYPSDMATTVVTPSLTVATSLLRRSVSSVHTLGGDVSPRTWTAGGPWTIRELHTIMAEVLFLGCSGFSVDGGAMTSDQVDAEVKRAMIASSRKVVLLADSSKIGLRHLSTFAELDQIDVLITGPHADKAQLEMIAAAGVDVLIAR